MNKPLLTICLFISVFTENIAFSQQDTVVQAKILDDGSQDAEKAFNAGIEFFNQKNFTESIKELDKAISLKPEFDKAYYFRWNAKLETKDNAGAMNDYSMALKIGQQSEYYFSRAQLK